MQHTLIFDFDGTLADGNSGSRSFSDLFDNIDVLSRAGFKLGILTSKRADNVKLFLDQHRVTPFAFIESGFKLLGKSQGLQKILKQQRLNKDEVIYIGDEVRDIAAAHAVGVKSIAVTWGLSDRAALEKAKPTSIASCPGELLTIVSQW